MSVGFRRWKESHSNSEGVTSTATGNEAVVMVVDNNVSSQVV